MRQRWGRSAGVTVLLLLVAASGTARAQDNPPAPAPAPAPPPVTVTAPASTTTAPSAPVTEPISAAPEEQPDHDRFIHHFGVTYFDITSLPIANISNTPMPMPGQITSTTVAAPVVGARYWISRMIGVDAGIGIGYSGGSQEAVQGSTDTNVDKASAFGFAFHGGVPIAFFHGKHYTFLLIPGFTIGATTGTFKPQAPPGGGMAPPEQDLSGFLFDIGARIGAEIHFGFIGIPELALQATVGMSFRRSVFKWKSDVNSASDGTNSFATTVDPDPWAIFKDAISATYYF